MMIWLKRNYLYLSYNIGLTIAVFLTGFWLLDSWKLPLYVMATLYIAKTLIGEPKHYKQAHLCAFWTWTVFVSLFAILEFDLFLSLLLAVFMALIISKKADIKDFHQWKKKHDPSKYQETLDFIKYNPISPELLSFEAKLKAENNLYYLVYKHLFKERKSWEDVSHILDLESKRLVPIADNIDFGLRMGCKI